MLQSCFRIGRVHHGESAHGSEVQARPCRGQRLLKRSRSNGQHIVGVLSVHGLKHHHVRFLWESKQRGQRSRGIVAILNTVGCCSVLIELPARLEAQRSREARSESEGVLTSNKQQVWEVTRYQK